MAKNSYKAEDIKILEGLDAVRLRPGMYIGTTSVKGLHHILWEIVDNAVDEAANGYANEILKIGDGNGSKEIKEILIIFGKFIHNYCTSSRNI